VREKEQMMAKKNAQKGPHCRKNIEENVELVESEIA
jgi:hypothetical protein